MATFYKASVDTGIRWWNTPTIPDMPKHFALVIPSLEPVPPPEPPKPPRLVLVLAAAEPPYYRVGPLTRTQTRTVLARLRQRDIPAWARPQIIGALEGQHIELYIDNREEHVMVWLALHHLGAQLSSLPERKVWLTGNALTKWSEGNGEPVRRQLLTGTAANGADRSMQRKDVNGQP